MRFFGDRGDGTIEETGNIGVSSYGTDLSVGLFGSDNCSIFGVIGVSGSGTGVYGVSATSFGVYGKSTDHYGITGSSTNLSGVAGISGNEYGGRFSGPKGPIRLVPSESASAPSHAADVGTLYVTSAGILYINTNGSTTLGKMGAQ